MTEEQTARSIPVAESAQTNTEEAECLGCALLECYTCEWVQAFPEMGCCCGRVLGEEDQP